MKSRITRREVLAAAAAFGGTLLLPGTRLRRAYARVRGANERIRVAILGCGDKGRGHVETFGQIEGVEVAAVCDPDLARLATAGEKLAQAPAQHRDFRRVLDDQNIDAVVIATPNHWHAPLTMLACAAGKHVYVEKPVSHTIWEGRKMVEAARKHDRIVQAGTQQRSDPALHELAADLKAGKYGKVLWIHGLKLQAREPIGKVAEPVPPPASVDYELWAGPAPKSPIRRKNFHYDWHWQWNWGDGELGNWGIHYIDDLLNVLHLDAPPARVVTAGNRFSWDDDGETPNVHLALYDLGGIPLIEDIRILPDPKRPEGRRPGGTGGAVVHQMRHGNCILCEGAEVRIARGGGKAYDRRSGEEIHHYVGTGGSGHEANFIDAVRSGKRADLRAEIEVSHRSTIACHMGNIAYRLGRSATPDEVRESFGASDEAAAALADVLEQLAGNGVAAARAPFLLGPELTFDAHTERFTGPAAEAANRYLRYEYRAPFARDLPA